MDEWRIEPFDRAHERVGFESGKTALDDFLHTLVTQYEKRNLGRTYVAVSAGGKRVRGYYTIASGAVSFQTLPRSMAKRLPKHPVPVLVLARLAVDRAAQGRGLGTMLLVDALRRCLDLARSVGVHAVEVDAIDDEARQFYAKYGFVPLIDSERHLYLPISAIQQAFGIR